MHTTITFQPTPFPRQPIIAFQPTLRPLPPTPCTPMHDFLVLSPCPDFTPELNTAGTLNYRERATQLCA